VPPALGNRAQRQLAIRGELIEIGTVLEEIGIQRTVGQRQIGLNIIIELDQLDLVALFLQLRHYAFLQQVIVGAGCGTDQQVLLGWILGQSRHTGSRQQCDCGGGQNGTAAGGKGKMGGHGSLLEFDAREQHGSHLFTGLQQCEQV
jgi:hypothetical protein